MTRGIRRLVAVGAFAALPLAAACGDSTSSSVSATASSLKDQASAAIDKGTARAQAEALRGLIIQKSGNSSDRYTSMDVLEKAVDALPGDPTVSGLTDANNDGKDDDGRLQVDFNGQQACVTVNAKSIDVANGACPG